MTDARIWLWHPETGGTFHCPADAAPSWQARGWEPCEPPKEINPAVAEYVPMTPRIEPAAAADESPDAASEPAPTPVTTSKKKVNDVG